MIYLEGPEYPAYVMHIFELEHSGTLKNRNMLGQSSPQLVLLNQQQKSFRSLCIFFA